MRLALLLIVIAVAGRSTLPADSRIRGVSMHEASPLPVDRLFGLQHWEFVIAEPRLVRLDLRLMLGEEELLATWLSIRDPGAESRLSVVIDCLDDVGEGRWRVHAAVQGQSSWMQRLIELPAWTAGRSLRWKGRSGVSGMHRPGRYFLMDLEYRDGAVTRSIPLDLVITLNPDAVALPPGAPAPAPVPARPPLAEPADAALSTALTAPLVAEAFGYPRTIIRRVDSRLDSDLAGAMPLWSVSFTAERGDTFAPVAIVAFRGGTFLSRERETGLAQSLEQAQRDRLAAREPRAAAIAAQAAALSARERTELERMADEEFLRENMGRVVELTGGTRAFVHLLGFGPGGSAWGFSMRSPDGSYDLLISMQVSGEGSAVPADSDATHAYYLSATTRPVDLMESAGRRIAAALWPP